MFDLLTRPDRWAVAQTSYCIERYRNKSARLIDNDGMADLWEGVAQASRVGIRDIPDLVMYAVYFARLELLYRARHNEEAGRGFEGMPTTTQPEPIGRGDYAFELWAERQATIHALEAADDLFVPWYIRVLLTQEDRIEIELAPRLEELKRQVPKSTP